MPTLSLCMIVRNEETVLARCLESARAAVDEIVIVDTGSTDRTRAIAQAYTPHVYDFPWCDDFAAARNFSFSKATMDYCLWLDADDVLQDAQGLRRFMDDLDAQVDVVMMPYCLFVNEDTAQPSLTYARERIVKRSPALFWQGVVHEVIVPVGRVCDAPFAVHHRKKGPGDPDRNLRIYEKRLSQGAALSPREQYYFARELLDHGQYARAESQLRAFLSGQKGWLEDNLCACRLLARCNEAQGKEDQALDALLHALRYAPPRAELCCDLGAWFMRHGDDHTAIFWYQTALGCDPADSAYGFTEPDCYDFLPYLQLCVCYDHLGDRENALRCHAHTVALRPQHPSVVHNSAYFGFPPNGQGDA